jgi:hypothetical protein
LKENIAYTLGKNLGDDVPVYDMPHLFDQTNKDQTLEQVSNLKIFFGSCLKLLNDKTFLRVFQSLFEK